MVINLTHFIQKMVFTLNEIRKILTSILLLDHNNQFFFFFGIMTVEHEMLKWSVAQGDSQHLFPQIQLERVSTMCNYKISLLIKRILASKSFINIDTSTNLTKTLILSKIDCGLYHHGNTSKSIGNVIKSSYHTAVRVSVYTYETTTHRLSNTKSRKEVQKSSQNCLPVITLLTQECLV